MQTLPFKVQYDILCTTQRVLEETLFYWTKRWYPTLLAKRRWQTPEALELQRYGNLPHSHQYLMLMLS
jgi:hypothetical protein